MIKKILFMMLAWVVLTLPALAEEKAADSMIASVQGDLNRYEPMVASMSPGSRSGARVSRFVPIMESRLSSSRHQQSASWLETSHRLKALKQALLDIKMGKTPSSPAPISSAKKTSPTTSGHSTAPVQVSMSDPDRARKIDALNSEFIRDINRVRGNDIAKPSIAHNFMQKIAAMQALSAGFQDNSLGYVQQVNGAIVEADQYLQKRLAAAEATAKNNHQGSTSTSMQNNMSDRDRAIKIEKLRSDFYEDFNRAGAKDLGHENIVKGFAKRIDVMKEMASGFQDNSISFVKQVKGFVVETEGYFKKRTAEALAMLKRNEQRRSSLHARNDNKQSQGAMTAQDNRGQANHDAAAQGQSERTIAALHRQFSKVYSRVRGALPYLNAETLADTEEARDWTNKVKAMRNIVNQYQDKNTAIAKKDIAIYEKVKRKVKSGLAQNSAAIGGLTTADLSRDHQALEELVVKYKPFFSKLDTRSTASIKQIEAFIQSGGKREITQALASFSSKYGNSPSEVAARFKRINGGRAWRTPERQLPESGFERLSSWSAQILELDSLQESVLAMHEKAGNSKKHYDLSSDNYREKDYLDMAEVNRDFEGYRKTLDTLLKEHPNRKKAQKYLAELDDVKRTYIDAMNKKIDNVKWDNGDKYFRGPGDLEELKQAAKDFIRLKDSEILIFSMYSGEWKVNDKDYLGRPINYFISFKYAKKMKDKPDTAMIYAGSFVTEGVKRSLPFVDYTGFNDVIHKPEIRIKNLH